MNIIIAGRAEVAGPHLQGRKRKSPGLIAPSLETVPANRYNNNPHHPAETDRAGISYFLRRMNGTAKKTVSIGVPDKTVSPPRDSVGFRYIVERFS
jgi:hypothetical protein